MKHLLKLSLLLLVAPAWASTHTVAACTEMALTDALGTADDDTGPTVEVVIPSCSGGSSISITTHIDFSIQSSVTLFVLRGQGAAATILVDSVTGAASAL